DPGADRGHGADDLRRPGADEPVGGAAVGGLPLQAVRHVLFRAGDQRFGLPLEAAREVVPPPRAYTRVPHAPASVLGVMNVRGRIVTVVDFARLLALPPGAAEPGAARVLVLEARKRDLGLQVEEVAGIS